MAIASLILSIAGFLIPFCSLIGLILGIVALNRLKKAGAPSGLAIAGIILGSISVLIGMIVGAIIGSYYGSYYDGVLSY